MFREEVKQLLGHILALGLGCIKKVTEPFLDSVTNNFLLERASICQKTVELCHSHFDAIISNYQRISTETPSGLFSNPNK